MWITARIKQHVFNLPDGQPFATRELLGYGRRGAVDKALERLVKAKEIIRLARGVFAKPLYEKGKLKLPTVAQIAITKARAFGKDVLLTHGKDIAHRMKILDCGTGKPTYVASGSSTSFLCYASSDFGQVRVHLRSSSPLSRKFNDSHIGLFFRAMRRLPQPFRHIGNFAKATDSINRTQRAELKQASRWMPEWLQNMFWTRAIT